MDEKQRILASNEPRTTGVIYILDSADKQVPLKKLPNNYPIREIGTAVDLPDEVVKNLIKQKELLQKVVELLRQLLLWIKK